MAQMTPEQVRVALRRVPAAQRRLIAEAWVREFDAALARRAAAGPLNATDVQEHLALMVRSGLGRWLG